MDFVAFNTLQALADVVVDTREAFPAPLYDAARTRVDPAAWRRPPGAPATKVFVKTDLLPAFARDVMPRVARGARIVVILGAADLSPDPGALAALVSDPRVARVLATNVPLDHVLSSAVVPLPIGFPEPDRPNGPQAVYAALYARVYGPGAPAIRDTVGAKRGDVVWVPPMRGTTPFRTRLAAALGARCAPPAMELPEYLARVAEHRAVLVPRGNGLDVHRIYEAILVGTVPVYVGDRVPSIVGALGLPWVPFVAVLERGAAALSPPGVDACVRILSRAHAWLKTDHVRALVDAVATGP